MARRAGRMAVALMALPLLLGAGENWGQEHSALTSDPRFAQSKAICRRIGEPRPPARDRPTPAQARALKGCDSEALYYGEDGQKPDYAKARLCAFQEDDAGNDQVFGGATILMQIYANGLGVPRNPDLATAYACDLDGAPAESDGRVLHMQALKTKPGRIDYCDDVTSGMASGYCSDRDSRLAATGRDGRLKALVTRLPAAARGLYPAMKKSFDAFVEAHGDGEVDQSGTARASMVIAEQDATRDQFVKDLDRLVSGQWPRAGAADAQAADAALNASYRKALAAVATGNDGTVKPEDVRTAQRVWLAYRDAYLRFAATAAPALGRDAVLARLTKLRTAQLDAFAS